MSKRVAFITGSTTGLGVQMAHKLAQASYQLALNYRHSQTAALQLQQDLAQCYQVNARLYQGDVSQQADVVRMIEQIKLDFGHLDILILNAGPFIHDKLKLVDHTPAQWHDMMSANLDSFFYLVKATVPMMEKQNWGRIIALGFDQIDQVSGWQYRGAYTAAKTGVAAAIRTLALEEKDYQITANMVCPGDIKADLKEADIEQAQKLAPNQTKRKAAGEDVARVIAFLCAEDSDYLTGNIINLAGGENIIHRHD